MGTVFIPLGVAVAGSGMQGQRGSLLTVTSESVAGMQWAVV